jgi:hypothetical protein
MHHKFGQDLKDILKLGFRMILFENLHILHWSFSLVNENPPPSLVELNFIKFGYLSS